MKKFLFIFLGLVFLGCNSKLPDTINSEYKNLPKVVDFNFHIRPILSDRCFHCHGPDENARAADLRLDVRESAIALLKDKEISAIHPNKPWESDLVNRILSHDDELIMPPSDSKLELTSREKALLIKWIEQGAEWKEHWAFTAPIKATLPEVKNTEWVKNELDYFVLNNLESKNLNPSPEANKETLIRRLFFDLIGLPPSIKDIQAFKNDTSERAYENLVDRLLNSPRYGERWAWEWLDVARYADTNGFQGDFTRDMWPWRDWVIKAFNSNMPYDDFTIRQLAGDLIPDATQDDVLASAFNRNHPYNTEGGTIPEETRVVNVFDRVETTGTVWLGLTLECARCHDHKFDAISQKEYYQLFDYFNQTSEEGGGWGGNQAPLLNIGEEHQVKEIEKIQAYIEKLYNEVDKTELVKFPREKGKPTSESKKAKDLNGLDPRILARPAKLRAKNQYKRLSKYFKQKDEYGKLIKNVFDLKTEYDELASSITQVMVMDNLKEQRNTYVLNRGGYDNPRLDEQVYMNTPKALPKLPIDIKNNRLALAKWLVSREQPLTSRVTVNRYWQAFFGNGIVKTVDDFGVQGELPTHPKLLDWLSRDFQDNHWDLKALFKKIVMSATYRQSSKVSSYILELDPENKLLSHASRVRLPSWMLRDQALFTSGLLVDSLGGKPVRPYQPSGIWEEASFGKIKYKQDHGDALYRRTLYTFWRRIVGPTVLFDNSTRQKSAVKAMRTNTPLHALNTLNDITYLEASRVLAAKVMKQKNSIEDRIVYIFKKITSRTPKKQELDILKNRLERLKEEYNGNLREAEKIIHAGEYLIDEELDVSELASYAVITSMILNLDETITRQ
ncbi:cytochrome c [Maribacter vaceletii]|uniref:Cytochrome c n=1 Tax=Maribacter vaceletii TaxID=1206816 RepID=A0A495EDW3_9FLAO|nr:PSD1 and planctomycete cytochrome C domain-containing protein [Maribacter vaceletii]RKR14087.1 cytochrome c [Maribacter vaceletii]